MPQLPPPPEGYEPDPLATVRGWGVDISSGFRDARRNKRVGGVQDSEHLDASALDLTPGKSGLSMKGVENRAREFARTWPGAKVLNEGDHVHIQLPGWEQAPGLPPPPEGFAPVAGPQSPDDILAPYLVPMSPHDAKAAAASVPEEAIKAMQIRTIQSPDNFAPAPPGLFTEPPMTQEQAQAAIARLRGEAVPPSVQPATPSRIGIAPAINDVTQAITGKPQGPVFDDSGAVREGHFGDQMPEGRSTDWTQEEMAKIRAYVPKAKSGADLSAYAQQLTGTPVGNADEVVAFYKKHGKVGMAKNPARPRPKPNVDAATGSVLRGFADPFNVLDEMGAATDALGVGMSGEERPNIFNSELSLSDIYNANLDRNRDILEADETYHPYARLGGQLASAVAIPIGAGARTPGALAKLGAIEGGAAGFGAGEGNPLQRLPNAATGTAIGAVAGPTLGKAAQGAGRLYRKGRSLLRRDPSKLGVLELNEPFTPAQRQRDYINIGPNGEGLPPHPAGFAPETLAGRTPRTDERLSPEAMAALAEGVDPRSVLPIPGNQVETLEEAVRANPGSLQQLQAPDEMAALGVRKIPSRKDFFRFTRVRGPLDITQRLRTMGGIRDEGGELTHLGVTNEPRRMAFGSNEQFLGRLVDNEKGMPLDEATFRLWEEGYFPGLKERPTPQELLDRLKLESMGQRFFHPDDMEEVANFGAAQAERGRIEAAEDAGSPLVDEVGESLSLDDLIANTPPAEAYEDMPRLTGRIGNLNLAALDRPQDVSQLVRQISQQVGGFSAAARGKVTNEETRRLAQELGLRPEQLLKRRQGQALNAEEMYATRALIQASRQRVAALAKKAVGGSDDDVAAFRKGWLKHVAIEEQASGATAEAGRALQQFKMLAKSEDAGSAAVRAYLKGAGGKERLEDAAEAIVDLMEDPARAGHFMREGVKPRWRDKFNELWINSLLSGPKTHVVNFAGNAMTTLLSLPEQSLAAGVGKVLRSRDRVLAGEVGARVAGMADSAVDALKAAKRGFITGEPADAVTKVEARDYQAIGGKLGQVIRTPTRALTAADEFWKTINSSAELRAIAYRKAVSGGGAPAEISARYESLVRAPSEDMLKQAQAAARYYTFQKELGPSGKAIQTWANSWPGAKIIVPFVRTPINLLKFAGERSAFGLLMPEVRQALRQGGRARDEALARITLGSGLSTAAVMSTMQGKMSGGGPADSKERASLLQSGWQPYSIRIGDQWVSYARFDPFSTLMGAAADFAEIGRWATRDEADKIALNMAQAIAKNVTNKTWLSGLSDAFEVLTDPERYGGSFVRRLAGSMAVPSLVNQTAQSTDPYLRDARTMLDAIKARVPVLSESVPVRRDIWGEPIERGSSLGPDIASPIYTTKVRPDPVRQEIARLRVPLSMPKRFLKIDGRRVDLTPEQYDELVQLTGKPAKQYLDTAITSLEWRALDDEQRREEVRKVFEDFRAAARDELKAHHPEFGGDGEAIPPPPPGFALAQ